MAHTDRTVLPGGKLEVPGCKLRVERFHSPSGSQPAISNLRLVAVVDWWPDRDVLRLLSGFALAGIGRMVAAVLFVVLLKPFDLK